MATPQDPATDFWAALGVNEGNEERLPADPPPDRLVARYPAQDEPAAAPQPAWSPMNSATDGRPAEPPARPAARERPRPPDVTAPNPAPQRPRPAPPERAAAAAPAQARPAPDRGWLAAEQLGRSLRSRVAVSPADVAGGPHREAWFGALTKYAHGDPVLAGRVYDVMSGWHLLGELWRDERIDEIHIRAAQVTTCGSLGIRQVPGFLSLARARQTVEAITAAQEKTGAVVTRVGESVIVTRRNPTVPDIAALVATGVATEEQLRRVEQALDQMEAVTVTGPAAPVIMQALTKLVPPGSRIFEAPFAVLPPGCVAAPSPLYADYVIGVRPPPEAEEMAAAGHLGALLANPRTPFRHAVQFTVTGRSSAPRKLVAT